eukprot:gene24979-10640_t
MDQVWQYVGLSWIMLALAAVSSSLAGRTNAMERPLRHPVDLMLCRAASAQLRQHVSLLALPEVSLDNLHLAPRPCPGFLGSCPGVPIADAAIFLDEEGPDDDLRFRFLSFRGLETANTATQPQLSWAQAGN